MAEGRQTSLYSLEELFFSFIVAIIFIFIFKLQKEIFNESYWATSDILSGIEKAPTFKTFFIRFLIILVFAIVLNYFISPKIIVFGLTLGSFLIVWPLFLNNNDIPEELLENKLTLRLLLLLFVLTTYGIAKLSNIIFILLSGAIDIYTHGVSYERIVNSIGDSVIWLTVVFILNSVRSYLNRFLSRKFYIAENIHESDSSYAMEDDFDKLTLEEVKNEEEDVNE